MTLNLFKLITVQTAVIVMLLSASSCSGPTQTAAQGKSVALPELPHVRIIPGQITRHEWGPPGRLEGWQLESDRMPRMNIKRNDVLRLIGKATTGEQLQWLQNEDGHVNTYSDDRHNMRLVIRENRRGDVVLVTLTAYPDGIGPEEAAGTSNQAFNRASGLYLKVLNLVSPDVDQNEVRRWLTTTALRRRASHSLVRGHDSGSRVRLTMEDPEVFETSPSDMIQLDFTIQRSR